jgi:hypothetical protein
LWTVSEALAAVTGPVGQEVHKFDETRDVKLSSRASTRMQYSQFFPFVQTLREQIGEDSENAHEIRVTECVWASVFREAGLDGEIGHAAVCNMDFTWPTAFNPKFKMERDHTLMQGHDYCNHRYIQIAPAATRQG